VLAPPKRLLLAMALILSGLPARADTGWSSGRPALSHFQQSLFRPDSRLRVLSIQPGNGGAILYETPPRKGSEVEEYAAYTCSTKITPIVRSEILDATSKSEVRPMIAGDHPYFQWGIEVRAPSGALASGIYISTDWTNQNYVQAEIDGKSFDITKPLIRWLEKRYSSPKC
jgi:hypothetical protein